MGRFKMPFDACISKLLFVLILYLSLSKGKIHIEYVLFSGIAKPKVNYFVLIKTHVSKMKKKKKGKAIIICFGDIRFDKLCCFVLFSVVLPILRYYSMKWEKSNSCKKKKNNNNNNNNNKTKNTTTTTTTTKQKTKQSKTKNKTKQNKTKTKQNKTKQKNQANRQSKKTNQPNKQTKQQN